MKEQFLLLIANNQGLIFKVCNLYCDYKEDKEDLFQDIVLQLWRSYPSFKQESKVSTWIYRVALNNAITRLRKKARTISVSELGSEAFAVPSIEINDDGEKMIRMYDAIKKLTEVERAITMLYMDDCSYKEMAEIVGLSESNIGFKLNQIKSKLRTLLNAE